LAFIVTTMVLLCSHVWMHYFTFLVFPFAACIDAARRQPPGHPTRRALLAIVAIATVLFNVNATWLVSSEVSDAMDHWGVLSAGLLVFWCGLGRALAGARAARRAHGGLDPGATAGRGWRPLAPVIAGQRIHEIGEQGGSTWPSPMSTPTCTCSSAGST
jgi:hypothetical protein